MAFSGDPSVLIARLIAEPAQLESRLDAAMADLSANGMPVAMARMLEAASDVLQLSLPEGDPAIFRRVIETRFAPTALLITDHEPQVPRLFVSDMDSTMIGQECIDELADYAGIKDRVAEITERAMRGELDFSAALTERVKLLAGLEEAAIATCLHERIRPEPGAEQLVQTLKAKGARTVLVTGGFHHFADAVADQLGFDHVVGNRLAVAQGKLTGGLAGPISDASTKLATLRAEAERLGEGARVIASGDGANDIPMLQAADYGFAYRAKPVARDAANAALDSGDLTTILKLLDVSADEWVSG